MADPLSWALIGTAVIGAGASIFGTIASNNAAEESARRQTEYQQSLLNQEKETEAKEKQQRTDALERQRAYGASLLDSDSTIGNTLALDDDTTNNDILTNKLGSGVDSMFA